MRRKCDFQVHTPRDPNWTGQRPIGQGEKIKETGAKVTAQDVDAARVKTNMEFESLSPRWPRHFESAENTIVSNRQEGCLT
jgi:hypothetical protein